MVFHILWAFQRLKDNPPILERAYQLILTEWGLVEKRVPRTRARQGLKEQEFADCGAQREADYHGPSKALVRPMENIGNKLIGVENANLRPALWAIRREVICQYGKALCKVPLAKTKLQGCPESRIELAKQIGNHDFISGECHISARIH
jgi:hypothetical protein